MDKFNALPFPQKVLVLIIAMVAVAALFYYGMILPLEEEQAQAVQQRQSLENEVAKMRQDLSQDKDRDLEQEKTELLAEKERFEKMLPKREELVKFITNLSETAKNAGLQLQSFTKGTPEPGDYYLQIPIKMEVRGTYRELIGFLRTISERDKRVVNIRALDLTRPRMAEVEGILQKMITERNEKFMRQARPQDRDRYALSPLQQLMFRVKATEEAIQRGVQIDAKFTAYVFTYTGELAPPDVAQSAKSLKETMRQKRKEALQVL